MVIKRTCILSFIVVLVVTVVGCGGLRYSQVAPEAKDFHPKKICVLPADAGSYEESKGVIDQVIAGVLVEKKWFTDVITADTVSNQIKANEELRKIYLDYTSKLKAVNFSDPELSRRMGEIIKADAFLLVNVDYWLYTRENDNKVAKVGMGIKMINASSGAIIWSASHYETDEYVLLQPKLSDVAQSVANKMIKEMPR